jgi:hypothetical protein
MSENIRRLKKYRPWTFQARATEEVQHEADIRVLHNDLVPRGAAGCQDHLSGDAGERAGRCEDDGGTSRPGIQLAEVVRSDQSAVLRWVRDVRIEAVPFGTAMQQILEPVGLRYEIENGSVVLSRAPNAIQPGDTERSAAQSGAGKSISYLAEKKSVQYIVIDLAAQVGLGYNWEKSFAQTDPECRQFVFNVSIKEQPFQKAMAKILDPVGLRYEVESGEVVLYRR